MVRLVHLEGRYRGEEVWQEKEEAAERGLKPAVEAKEEGADVAKARCVRVWRCEGGEEEVRKETKTREDKG